MVTVSRDPHVNLTLAAASIPAGILFANGAMVHPADVASADSASTAHEVHAPATSVAAHVADEDPPRLAATSPERFPDEETREAACRSYPRSYTSGI